MFNSIKKITSKILYVLQDKRKHIVYLLFIFLFVSLLETIGTAMIGPFIALATNPNIVKENYWLTRIYDALNLSSQSQMILIVGILVILIYCAKAYFSFNAQRYIFWFGFNLQGELSARLMRAYLAAPYTFHLNRNSANLIQHITKESSTFANALVMPFLTSTSNLVIIIALSILLIKTNPIACFIVVILPLMSLVFYNKFKERLSRWGKESYEAGTEMFRQISHGLGGLKETKIIGCESYFEQKVYKEAKQLGRVVSLSLSYSNLPRYIIEVVMITFLISFCTLFVFFNKDDIKNLSAILGIFALASMRLLPATGNVLSSVNGIRSNLYSLDQLYLDLKELESLDSQRNNIISQKLYNPQNQFSFSSHVIIDSISYRYPNASSDSIHEISLKINKGESIGLIGKSGAGKTTLVDTILGLLEPQSGDILIDGNSIYKNLRSWQNKLGYVPQSIFLIDDTLERNIAFGVPDEQINQERLLKAIQSAQLTELVDELPNGINQSLGERGVLLSGGQRQRVGIARALYHEREILVFDEATAALDNETEKLVTESIKSLSGIKTMIIIAHRLSTIEHCDRIYMLDRGRVIKSGNYQEVILNQ
jgi:ATP-binding cassette, subfamily B, bacterial PglK